MRGREDVQQLFPDCLSDLKARVVFFTSGKKLCTKTPACWPLHTMQMPWGQARALNTDTKMFSQSVSFCLTFCALLLPYLHSVSVTGESRLLSPESSWATYSLIKFMRYIVTSLQCSRIRGKNSFLFQRFSRDGGLPSLSHSLLVNVNVQHGKKSTGKPPAHAASVPTSQGSAAPRWSPCSPRRASRSTRKGRARNSADPEPS